MRKKVLLAEPAARQRARFRRAARGEAYVTPAAGFEEARAALFAGSWDFLVTNLRLGAYNGLHLVHLAASKQLVTRSIVYSGGENDAALARTVQEAGAFYEREDVLDVVLPSYFRSSLPPSDRRDAARRDRRQAFRGGRRASDVHRAVEPVPG
jgi:hypothetical protein